MVRTKISNALRTWQLLSNQILSIPVLTESKMQRSKMFRRHECCKKKKNWNEVVSTFMAIYYTQVNQCTQWLTKEIFRGITGTAPLWVVSAAVKTDDKLLWRLSRRWTFGRSKLQSNGDCCIDAPWPAVKETWAHETGVPTASDKHIRIAVFNTYEGYQKTTKHKPEMLLSNWMTRLAVKAKCQLFTKPYVNFFFYLWRQFTIHSNAQSKAIPHPTTSEAVTFGNFATSNPQVCASHTVYRITFFPLDRVVIFIISTSLLSRHWSDANTEGQ